ncbi:hypothetical protein AB0L56_29640 [Streptomyces sp. NPDC052079]|uniref:hypothetical protein n=1 Tax=Streptomyces sp. NPDC052079 TaxID=3155526 RepID=UPI003438B62C
MAHDTTEQRRLALEKKRERYVWYYLGYFLFGIHIVAFVMIYAVTHAKAGHTAPRIAITDPTVAPLP